MALLTAREAARRLNRDERTIRRWVSAGKLTPRTSASNRLAIDEQDIERLVERLTERDQQRRGIIDLEDRVLQLEQEQAAILARLALLEERAGTFAPKPAAPDRRPRSLATPADVPPGSRQATEFAAAHGVHRVTFRDHMTIGIRGDLVAHISIPKPNKPRETDRWLSPEQQQAAVDFWQRHGTTWQRCSDPACLVCGDQQDPGTQHMPGGFAPGSP